MCQWVELTLGNGEVIHDRVDCNDPECPQSSAGG